MKRLFFALVLISQSLLLAQEISFSKDSLYIVPNNFSYTAEDSVLIFNNGQSNLRIDSIKGANYYSYDLEVKFADSTNFYRVIFDAPSISFLLAPQDSVKLIFSNPDLCPICDDNSGYSFFTDTLTFFSNSILNSKYDLFVSGDGFVNVNSDENSITNFNLYQNYPNPFNPSTNISYTLTKEGYVNLSVYNLLGESISTLVNKRQGSGLHNVLFNASYLSSGVYIYKLIFNGKSISRKMLLLR